MPSERFVAVGLLTRRDLDVLGSGFRRAFPLNNTTDFTALLAQIDQAEHDYSHNSGSERGATDGGTID